MPSDSRSQFLAGLEALRKSLDSSLVSASDDVGAFLRRGLTIVGYNLLETFIASRLEEVARHINSGSSHFIDLPDRLQKAATFDVLRFASSRLQRNQWDPTAAFPFMTEIGESLAASVGPVRLSSLTWQWLGSNMSAEDLHRAMRLFHVERPWETIENISNRIGSPMLNPKKTVEGLHRERNSSAHDSAYQVSNLLIRAVPAQLQVIGMAADTAISVAAHEMHLANTDFYSNENWMSGRRISFRYVKQRSSTWAEILEGTSKAYRVGKDQGKAVKDAIARARGKYQVVVVQNDHSQLTDWLYPEVP